MAANYRTSKYRTTDLSKRDKSGFYVYGNTVRQAETLPKKTKNPYSQQREQTKRTSSRVVKNRNRAMSISPAYAVFLTAAAVCAVLICVLYLNLQSEVVSRSENVTAMQEQLADLTEANNTAYNSAADSVNLETVRDKAMNEMGMVYAAQGTIVEYDSPEEDYVKQYNDIPESGVLAKSGDVLK